MRIAILISALVLLAAGCDTVKAGGEFAMPVWAPQVTAKTFAVNGDKASVSLDWRTGQAPFTVDIEMPSDFTQQQLITTDQRHVSVADIPFLRAGIPGNYDYTVNFRIRDALGQVTEVNSDHVAFSIDNLPPAISH